MPWPFRSRLAHSVASRAGTGLSRRQHVGRLECRDDVAEPGRHGPPRPDGQPGGRPAAREPGRPGEQPLRQHDQQVLARAELGVADADLGRIARRRLRATGAQVDADRLAVRRGDVEPADVLRRCGAQADQVRPLQVAAGGVVELVPAAPVVGDRELLERDQAGVLVAQLRLQRRGAHSPRRDEPRARAGLRERHEAQLAADGPRVERDRQPDRDEPVGSFLTGVISGRC